MGWFNKSAAPPSGEEIHGIMVTLRVGGEPSLFIMLGSDGDIKRLGTGTVDNAERDMFIGRTDPALFGRLREQATPELLAWCGKSLADPQPQGQVCELTVGFRRGDGQELITNWQYGSESQGPPPEIGRFVIAAVEATNPWFNQQQAMARGGGT